MNRKNIIYIHLQNVKTDDDGITRGVFNPGMAYQVCEKDYYNMYAPFPYTPRHTIELPNEMTREEVVEIDRALSSTLGHSCTLKQGDEICEKYKKKYSVNKAYKKTGVTELIW